MKKTFLFILALCALLFTQTAHADKWITDVVTEDYIRYTLYDDYTAAITYGGYTGTEAVTLQSTITYEGKVYTLTTIGDGAFASNSGMTSIIIPNSVSTIGAQAFYECSNLESVTIGAFVQSIGKEAFVDCSSLTDITFYPTTPPDLGDDTFSFKDNTKLYIYALNADSYDNLLNDYTLPNFITYPLDINKDNYIKAVLEAITLAANRVALSVDEETAIYSYKAAISSAEDVQSVPEIELAAHKVIAQAGVTQALPDDGLTTEEQTVVNGKIAAITNATCLHDIYAPQTEALAYIAVHKERMKALADIKVAMDGTTNSVYLNNLVKEQVDAINSTTDTGTIKSNKETAVDVLNIAVPSYKAAQAEDKASLPSEGTTGNGVRITLGTKSVELMNPDKVEFFKVSTEE